MNILHDLKQTQLHQQKGSKSSSSFNPKKASSKSSHNYEVEMQIGITYNEILSMIKDNGLSKQLQLPEDGVKAGEKLELVKKVVEYLAKEVKNGVGQNRSLPQQSNMDESNMITCVDCQNYENNLQKLQNQVRQHIRLQQQLKIYQESMQQKIQQLTKQKTSAQKKYEELKKKHEQQKHSSTNNNEKLHKLQFENEKLKTEIKQMKQLAESSNSKKIKGYESRDRMSEREKENKIDWVHRMSSINKKEEPLKERNHPTNTERTQGEKTDRKSVDKRGDSSDRWRMSGARSTKIINFNQKIIQEKNKEQRKKAIQSKFEYRR